MVARIIEGHDKIFLKKHRRTSPEVNFRKLSLTKQKLDLERTLIELGKPFPKKKSHTKIKNLKINVKMPHVNKKTISSKKIWFKPKNKA